MANLGSWGAIEATWSPWFQARPELHATVTRLDGQRAVLEPETISEAPVESERGRMYTDRRRLEAPLPGLAAGAIVERVIVLRDHKPFIEGASLAQVFLGTSAPTALAVLEVEVPRGVPLTYQVRGLDLEPVEVQDDGAVLLTFEAREVPALGPSRMLLPPEQPRRPQILLSTAPSWSVLAKTFGATVERQLAGADVKSLLKGLDRTRSRREVVQEILRRVHAEIRYTGLELGEQAIVPRRPEETLGRRFGDCKDKGALLIALLRAVDIPAYLALVRSGSGEDVVPEVPGLEMFNHAIVFVPGAKDIWVDATRELLPAGELPVSVQGRHALVVGGPNAGLVRVPEVEASKNRYLESRRVKFSDWGPVEVTERTEATGEMEHRLRRQLLGVSRSQVESSLTRYVKRAYRAERVRDFQYGEPRDLKTPFAVEVTAEHARVGVTKRNSAKIQLATPVLFGFLPDLLRDAALGQTAAEDDRERRAAAMLIQTRASDLVLSLPFEAEIRYELIPPSGFELKVIPEPVDIALGPGRYRYMVETSKDGTIVASLSLRTGKRRFSAVEARAFVTGLAEVWELPVPKLEFVHIGARLLASGKPREAIATYRELIEAAPLRASHHSRLAEALLEVGLGTAARHEAQKAVALAPDDGPVLMTLGRVLASDPYGRERAPGFDRQGALEAFRRILELEPDNVGARIFEARLLEVDDWGQPNTSQEDWRSAANAYRVLRDRTGDTEFDARLLLALYSGQDFERLYTLASRLPPQGPAVAMQLVAASIMQSPGAALEELGRLTLPRDERQAALETAASSLVRVRAYEAARRLMLLATKTAEDPLDLQRRLLNLAEVERVERDSLAAHSPEGAVKRLLFAMLDPPLDDARIGALFSRRALGELGDDDTALARLTEGLTVFLRSAHRARVPLAMVRDNLITGTRFEATGSKATGFRVVGRMSSGQGPRESVWFVVYERGRYRIRASESVPSALGEEALHLLQQGNVRAARRWLDWAADSMMPFSGRGKGAEPPFMTLRREKAPATVQAAALAATGSNSQLARRHLERAMDALTEGPARDALEWALLMVYIRMEAHQQAYTLAAQAFDRDPASGRAFTMFCNTALLAGEVASAEEAAKSRLTRSERDERALVCLSDAAVQRADVGAARRWLQRRADQGTADPITLNNIAWLSLFTGNVTAKDAEAALRSNVMTGFEDPSKLHTLAAIYAEQGKIREAHQLFVKRLELRGASKPEHVDGFLLGRIMEQLGLEAQAVEAYRTVRPEPRAADSTYRLAQKRLELLRGRGAAKTE